MGLKKLKIGDLVLVDHNAEVYARNEEIAEKGIVMSLIHPDWYRVYMSWKERTKVIDFPRHMLKRIGAPDVEKG